MWAGSVSKFWVCRSANMRGDVQILVVCEWKPKVKPSANSLCFQVLSIDMNAAIDLLKCKKNSDQRASWRNRMISLQLWICAAKLLIGTNDG
jgi:hypothetical protein